ncbi:MAG: hypothetical protein NTW21_22865 [Verrucomicrobia bacterium]|nr:hypothetical protein [Verrucomicrobiota bacterium]
MKATHQLLILSAAFMSAVSCTTITGETNTSSKVKPGVPGAEVVKTTRITATVTGIDTTKRKVTLVTPGGEKFHVKAGPEVANFSQIRVGDQLKATLTEEVVVRMAKPGEKIGDDASAGIGIAPLGAKPGVVTADTIQLVGTVTAIDLKKHQATLRFSDGSSKSFAVRKDVDLTKRKVGERVVIRSTEVFAILLEKP